MNSSDSATALLVLNPNVEISPLRDFDAGVRNRLGGAESDFILSELRSRASSRRLDAETAGFLKLFAEPRRIIEAVIAHSTTQGAPPAEVLKNVYPLVAQLRDSGILVDSSRPAQRTTGARFAVGEVTRGLTILRCAHALADTEIYQAAQPDGTHVAFKYVRPESPQFVQEALRRDYTILQLLQNHPGCRTPRPLAADLDRPDPQIIIAWCEGETASTVAQNSAVTLDARAGFVSRLLSAYRQIHAAGVLHGDVHPLNVLIDARGEITILDFGAAWLPSSPLTQRRIGLVPYYEPEVARAVLADLTAPPATDAGEQYTVAILAYLLLTGNMYLPLSLETDVALRQIAEDPPRPFAESGLVWPEVEQLLRRALAKEPSQRFPSFADFAAALERALAHPPATPAAPARAVPPPPPSEDAVRFTQATDRFLGRCGLAGVLTTTGLIQGPTASIYHGAAGIAYALLRIACLRSAPEPLAAADLWISRAIRDQANPASFVGEEVGITAGLTGQHALFHSMSGLHAVNALVRHAAGDLASSAEAVRAFMVHATAVRAQPGAFALDATNGAASLLLGAALLRPICRAGLPLAQLRACAASLSGQVLAELATPPSGKEFLGFAHGRAGAIYALLQWAHLDGTPPPAGARAHLDALAALAVIRGEGVAWPLERGVTGSPQWSGWCHGSAGHILLWTAAARAYREERYLFIASSAGKHLWHARGGSGPTLCCGLAGEAFALFELARRTGDDEWLERGRVLARQAVDPAAPAGAPGLFRGDAGIALLAAETQDPARAVFPFCQSPG